MIAEPTGYAPPRRVYDLGPQLRALGRSDSDGVPVAGRVAEIAALRETGARNASLGRICDGHLNGVQLVARCETAAQRAAVDDAVAAGHLFGVWNTQAEDLGVGRGLRYAPDRNGHPAGRRRANDLASDG